MSDFLAEHNFREYVLYREIALASGEETALEIIGRRPPTPEDVDLSAVPYTLAPGASSVNYQLNEQTAPFPSADPRLRHDAVLGDKQHGIDVILRTDTVDSNHNNRYVSNGSQAAYMRRFHADMCPPGASVWRIATIFEANYWRVSSFRSLYLGRFYEGLMD
jgi:hypothetical protein